MNKPLSFAAMTLAAVAVAASGAANSREVEPKGTPAAVERVYACRQVSDSAQRLACFDAATAALAQAEAANDIVFVDREAMREARKGLFGFNLPKIKLFGGGGENDKEEAEEFKTLTSTIERTGQYAPGKWYFILPDGARWQQIDTQEMYRDPRSGEEIVIKKAALGSYMANIAGRHAIRVTRVQ